MSFDQTEGVVGSYLDFWPRKKFNGQSTFMQKRENLREMREEEKKAF